MTNHAFRKYIAEIEDMSMSDLCSLLCVSLQELADGQMTGAEVCALVPAVRKRHREIERQLFGPREKPRKNAEQPPKANAGGA